MYIHHIDILLPPHPKTKKTQELKRLPLGIGARVAAASAATPNARGDGVPEDFIAPIILPSLPSRFYFLFGASIDAAAAVAAEAAKAAGAGGGGGGTEGQRAAAQRVYGGVRREVCMWVLLGWVVCGGAAGPWVSPTQNWMDRHTPMAQNL